MTSPQNRILDIWGERTPYVGEWPTRLDEQSVDTPDRWVQSACVLCSNGCGMDIGVKDGKIVGVRGRSQDRVNKGRLGPKGLNGWVANASPDRLTQPLIRRGKTLEPATWEQAMNLIVSRSREVIKRKTSLGMGFYTSGQLFIEEYYTLAVLGKAGLGTPHMDGNTRLCTATAAAALMETFGSDGQPGTYTDLDTTEAILLVGHNIAEQQTVLWARILDRLAGPNPPKLIVIDPRLTLTAQRADVHLPLRVGTNIAVLNGLIRQMIEAGHVDQTYLDQHTVGFDELKATVAPYTPEHVETLSGVPADRLRAAAQILGTTPSLVSTALQGVYQSMQATAAACQVNNINLLRGMIGKPGCGIYQMNGQPTSQNTRETGCDGALPAFRNWDNPQHIQELADLWNVHPDVIPHWKPPTHSMEIFQYAEQGSIEFLWISATNPAVSMPNVNEIRKILTKDDLFVVVQDAFLTETAALADVVLPAALWGEKTGTFTNVDRTVHISHQAIDPPGQAKSDLDIFLEYARRMDFRDQNGAPLIKWQDPEGAFEAWKACTRGRMCDYTGMSYAKLSEGSGIQWPCNEQHPDGTERLYTDSRFNTGADVCESFGHDLETGASYSHDEYAAHDPQGRATLKAVAFQPPHEQPDDEYPLMLTTGRQVYHFHTRTKTARAPRLNRAAPDAYLQVSVEDAERYGVMEGDWLEVKSRRGTVVERAMLGGIEPGMVFLPFHYGYWDQPDRPRAANELTLFEWDPVSKQPHFKYSAVKLRVLTETEVAAYEQPQDVNLNATVRGS